MTERGEPGHIRPLTLNDLDAVMVLEPVLFGSGSWSRASYRDELAHPNRSYLAATEGGTLVGYAGLATGTDSEIMTIGVAEHARRRGHAQRMLAEMIGYARRAGAHAIFLEVRAQDAGAQALYRSFGFTGVGVRPGYYEYDGADALVMRLPLRAGNRCGPVGAEAIEEDVRMSDDPTRRSVLITAAELQDALATGTPLVVLDVRWSLAEPDSRKFYVAGHIPGAQFVDLDGDLAAPASVRGGRHPLPELDALQSAARRWGIDDGDSIVVYDDTGGTSAARAWWLLRWAGIENVRILDGGLHSWSEIGGVVEDGDVLVAPGTVTLSGGHLPVADADDAATAPRRGVLLDARAPERYAGDVEPVDSKAGHIPGAVSAPTVANLDAAQRFRSTEQLTEQFALMGVPDADEVVVYCGSGVTAAHEVAALAAIGVQARLYAGSWSQWSADDARPVAIGIHPAN